MLLFDDLQRMSARRKDTYSRMEAGGIINSTWFNPGNGTFAFTWDQSFDGVTLDVVGVRLLNEILRRADTGADCIAQTGTYFYAKNPGGILQLSVHLAGNANPSNQNVLVLTAFHDCTGAERREHLVQPELGEEKFTDATLSEWSGTPLQLTHWTEVMDFNWQLVQDAPIVRGDVFSAKIEGLGPSGSGRIRQAPSVPAQGAGQAILHRWFGYYRSPKLFPSTAGMRIRVGTTNTLSSDGRHPNGALDGLDLEPTVGKTRAYVFDYVSHETNPNLELIVYNTAASNCHAWYGRMSLKKVHGWNRHEPRITLDGLPEVFEGGNHVFPGAESTGAGEIRLNNDGTAKLERRFSFPYVYPSRAVQTMMGGLIPGREQEILLNDMYRAFRGTIRGDRTPVVNARQATIAVESVRTILEAMVPPRKYDIISFPNIESRDTNRARPVVFGFRPHTRPAGISFTTSTPLTGYRRYEFCDVTDWPNGTNGVGQNVSGEVWAYTDEEAADKQDPTKRVALIDSRDFIQDTLAGTFDIVHDVRVIKITLENNKIDADVGGGTVTATIPVGVYILGKGTGTSGDRGLLEQVMFSLAAATGVGISATYDESTHLVTISRIGKGQFDLLWQSGPHSATSIGPTLGFDNEDDTGAAGYSSDEVLFTDADSSHIIRADVGGYMDDCAGSFTGTPGQRIETLSPIFCFCIEVFLKEPRTRYNAAEWLAARTLFPQVLGVYLGGLGEQPSTMTLADFIDRLEAGSPTEDLGPAEIVLDGEGVFRISQRTFNVPEDAPHVHDHDLIEQIEGYFVPPEVYRFSEIRFDRNAATGKPKTFVIEQELAKLLYGSDERIALDTWLTDETDADHACQSLAALARAAIRHFRIVCKTLVLTVRKGDLIRVTVDQALLGAGDPGPGLDGTVFRVLSKKLNQITHKTELVVFTNIVT